MKKMFQDMSVFEFQKRFPDDQACYNYLSQLKWPEGFRCERCAHQHCCRGKHPQARQCTKCGYQGTPTSGTLFHKVKFPLLKAFYIIYYMSTNKKGIASTELSRKLSLRQKTCWAFQQKVSHAMASGATNQLESQVEVDETVIGGHESGVRGRKNIKKRLLVVGIERKKGGVSRLYAQKVTNGGSKELRGFFNKYIAETSEIRTDKWRGYSPLKSQYPRLFQEESGYQGKNFSLLHRCIMMLKNCIRGTHHSVERLPSYLSQYVYRFNNRFLGGGIFDDLLQKAMKSGPITYQQLEYALKA